MKIWIDADACPGAIKEIVIRAADRVQVEAVFVANQPVRVPASKYVRFMQVDRGFDAADRRIVELLEPQDLVITADVPLAAAAIEKHAHALSPRGERFTPDNVRERLSIRNFMQDLREGGVRTGGPAALDARDKQAFANQLDAILAKRQR
jgi:uncharacterized protein YaiI (UPF0178 family)